MKFCTNCGNKLEPNARFCTKCGAKIPESTTSNKQSETKSNLKQSADSNKTYIAPTKPKYVTPRKQKRKKKKSIGWIIFITIVILALIAALAYAILHFTHIGDNQNETENNNNTEQTQQAQPNNQNESNSNSTGNHSKNVKIDVLSEDFHSDFMTKPHINGYDGFNIDNSKQDIEDKFGDPSDYINVDGQKTAKYGDMAVTYDKHKKVERVYVAPSNITVDAFKSFFNEPEEEDGDTWYYDADKNNGFTIKVYTDGQYIQAIENIDQQ